MREQEGAEAAGAYLVAALQRNPTLSGVARVLGLVAERAGGAVQGDLQAVQAAVAELLADYSDYECRQCGFSGRNLHWQCPSCRSWGTVKPIVA
jgi:lipopolysaccharide biosynthesis regulator YciM